MTMMTKYKRKDFKVKNRPFCFPTQKCHLLSLEGDCFVPKNYSSCEILWHCGVSQSFTIPF